jgi:hypothetical protein
MNTSNRRIIIPPLALKHINLRPSMPHLKSIPLQRHLKIHGIRKDAKGFTGLMVLVMALYLAA